ncbi:MAG: hypothetical protein Tsb002_01540 [Wenzhouxiangellaceae bacterium]
MDVVSRMNHKQDSKPEQEEVPSVAAEVDAQPEAAATAEVSPAVDESPAEAPPASADSSAAENQEPSAPAAEKQDSAAPAAAKSGGGGLALLALVLVIALAGGGYWLHQRLTALEGGDDDQVQRLLSDYQNDAEAALQQNQEQVAAQLRGVDSRLEAAQQELSRAVAEASAGQERLRGDFESRLAAVSGQQARIDALQTRLDGLTERIEQVRQGQQPVLQVRWQAARDLLAVGALQMSELHDARGALEHYQAARQLLMDDADERAAMVVSVMDEEIERLQNARSVDRMSYREQLSPLLAGASDWPLRGSDVDPATAEATPEGWWGKIKATLGKALTIRRADELDRVQEDALRQALRLHLLAMQAALVIADQAALAEHSSAARAVLKDYFALAAPPVAAADQLLSELETLDLTPPAPPLGAAQRRLNTLMGALEMEGSR